MQKRNFFKSPFGIAAIICFVIAIASPFVFVESQVPKKETTPAKTVSSKAEATVTPSKTEEGVQTVQGTTSYNASATPAVSVQVTTNTTQQTAQPTATNVPQPTTAPAKQTFQVSLKINGSSVGNVDMEEGNNQCDVLSRAKDQGKISQLLMKYDNNLGTNGVYQINGIGKDNAVWWVYKVNGASPTQGCSHIKANSGDTVEWEYKG